MKTDAPKFKLLFLFALMLWAFPLSAQDKGVKTASSVDAYGRYLLSIKSEITGAENKLHENLRNALASGLAGETGSQLQDVKWRVMTLKDLILAALKQNLQIQRSRLNKDYAEAALQEAKSLFDPVLNLSTSYNRFASYDRVEFDKKYRQATTQYTDESGSTVDNAISAPDGPIEYFEFDQPAEEGKFESRIIANEASFTGPLEVRRYNMSVNQALPWGMEFDLFLGLFERETFFINNYGSRFAGQATFGSYDRPWTSFLSLAYSTPLPWTRNSGSESSRDTAVQIARLEKDRAYWEVRSFLNNTLALADAVFWDLVASVKDIATSGDHLEMTENLLSTSSRMFKLGRITAGQYAQMEAEREQVRTVYQNSWLRYILLSNQIRDLLAIESDIAILPAGFSSLLEQTGEQALSLAGGQDARANPDVQAAELSRLISQSEMARSDTGAAPDLNFDLGYTMGQIGSRFGYESAGESLGKVTDPDYVTTSYSLIYVYPLGNRAAKARRQQALANYNKSVLGRDDSVKAVSRNKNNAVVAFGSSKKRLDLMRKSHDLAKFVLEKAVALQKSRGITEYELVAKSRNLLLARRNLDRAAVNVRKAWSATLAADGLLASALAKQAAANQTTGQNRRIAGLGQYMFFNEVQP